MTSDGEGDQQRSNPPESSEDLARAFRLRGEPPRIVRLSRKVLAGGSAVALLLIGGAVLWALQNNGQHARAPQELYSTEHHDIADGLAALPRDYGAGKEIPSLGPPLPGDLGRPILAAQGQSSGSHDRDQQQRDQEAEAARVSRLFVSTNIRETSTAAADSRSVSLPSSAASNEDEALVQNGQDRKLAFVNAPVDHRTTSPDRLAKPASPYLVQAGTVVPAALITGIRSDLPGQITAQVTENVYDTPTGRFLLIPQGARLIGIYDSQVAFGHHRLAPRDRRFVESGRAAGHPAQSQHAADVDSQTGIPGPGHRQS